MKVQALGPLVVQRDGGPVDLGARQQQAVFALLLINRNRAVSFDQIVDAIWGEDAEGKVNTLRVYVSRLRSALEPDRERGASSILETRGTSYQLNIDGEQFDVARFEEQVAEGRTLLKTDPTAAAELLQTALSSWHGGPYEDFAYDEFCQGERSRLEEQRIAALEDRLDADLARGLAGELVSEIELLRDRHPLRERLVGQQALALYRSGRSADALRAIDRFRRHISDELGIDPSPDLRRLEEQLLLHDPMVQPRTPLINDQPARPPLVANPFKGLRPFATDDASTFFGRDALVAEVLRTLAGGQRLVALVGASGSGKSSAVRAGIVPAIAKGAIEGSDGWLVASMMPGAHPFAELEGALLRTVINGPDSLREQLADDDAGLVRAALRILPDDGSRLLLVIDQFEELFTMVEDEAVQNRFLSNLVTAVDDPHDRISILITLRADFYSKPLQHPAFGARVGAGIVNVTPMSNEELEAAALRPAELAGAQFEPALLGQLIADVNSQPGALPLFQYALTELFDRRSGDVLMSSTYRAMGGLEGAMQRRATELFERFDDDEANAARQLFLRLVTVTDHDQRSRRRVPAREVASVSVDTATMQKVIGDFGAHRLLSFDSDQLTGGPTVEVAHEALLTAWPTLEGWIDESRNDLRRHASLRMTMHEWELAEENPSYLLPAGRLAEYEQTPGASTIALNDAEQRYVDASFAHVEAERLAQQQQKQDADRGRRRLWTLVGALAASLAVAGLFLFDFVGGAQAGPTVVFFGNSRASGWPANVALGLDRAEREFDMNLEEVPYASIPSPAFREVAGTEPEIVITDGFSVNPDALAEFPDIHFGLLDWPDAADNASTVTFAYEEGGFLAGVAAARKTESDTVGFVGGAQIAVIEEIRAGFEAGVRSVDPEIVVLTTFVDQEGVNDFSGFTRPDVGRLRADALYQRGADVVFAAAGDSGSGVLEAVVEQSAANGQQLWVIGMDQDQWFNANESQRPHVLTSIIKRGDTASYRLVEHILGGGERGTVLRLGVADEGLVFSTQGDGLTLEIVESLEQSIADIASDRAAVPTVPSGAVLLLDVVGEEADDAANDGIDPSTESMGDGLAEFTEAVPGDYELATTGTPVSLTVGDDWIVFDHLPGHTAFGSPDSQQPGDLDVVFLRPQLLAEPTQPWAALETQTPWPLDDIEGWLDNVADGIVTGEPELTEIGGRQAIYFEVEVTDADLCGSSGFCVAFFVNTVFENGGVSGATFELGQHRRVWWIDGGGEGPLVIMAGTPRNDRSFQAKADELLDTVVIGEPQPHPAPGTGF